MKIIADFENTVVSSQNWMEYVEIVRKMKQSVGKFRLKTLGKLNVELLPHQVETIKIVLEKMNARAIIADEVGLGKTIEAGVIIKELVEDFARSVLLLVPTSLIYQWKREMEEKFNMEFKILRKDTVDENYLLTSLELAKSKNYFEKIVEREWDVVVVDEAHKLRNPKTKNFELVNSLKTRHILLLTATPIQNSIHDIYSLVSIVKPGLLGTLKSFERQYIADKRGLEVRNVPMLRKLLSEVMVRHRYEDTLPILSKRIAKTFLIDLNSRERNIWKSIRNAMLVNDDTAWRLRFISFERGFCSSPSTLRKMLWKSIDKSIDISEKRIFLRIYDEIRSEEGSKISSLKRILDMVENYAVIYTNYIESSRQIQRVCEELGINAVRYDGIMNKELRRIALKNFQEKGGVLVSTDAGGEGLNLQFCNLIINYDLPWNPMKVEQRIGRVHRIGQTKDVLIVNMAYRETIDEHVLYILDRKLRLFTRVIGEANIILGEITSGRGLESSLIKIMLKAKDEKEIERRIREFEMEIDRLVREYEHIKEINERILGSVVPD